VVMNLKLLWERYKAQRRVLVAAQPVPVEPRGVKPFQPLTHSESVAILDDAAEWLIDEARATLAMPDGPSKDRRKAELRGRNQSMGRDFARLVRKHEC